MLGPSFSGRMLQFSKSREKLCGSLSVGLHLDTFFSIGTVVAAQQVVKFQAQSCHSFGMILDPSFFCCTLL